MGIGQSTGELTIAWDFGLRRLVAKASALAVVCDVQISKSKIKQ
jgi:hypothetical protein